MANKMIIADGDLLSGGVVGKLEIHNSTGADIRIKASGTGSCKVVGKLTANDDYKVLDLVRLSDFTVTDTITDNEIYAADVSGLSYVSLANASGFTKVFVRVTA